MSAEDQRRRGHATALLGELHGMLANAGLERVVAIIAEVRFCHVRRRLDNI